MARKIIRPKNVKRKCPERSRDVPATQGMLYEVRDELIKRMDAIYHGSKSDFKGVKSEILSVKSEVHGLKSEIHGLKGEVHRIALLVEEQNARNAIVLDGLTSLFDRQDRVENEVRDFRKISGQTK